MFRRAFYAVLTVCAVVALVAGFRFLSRGAFPSRPPEHEGTVESIEGDRSGTVRLSLRVAPVPADEGPATENARVKQMRLVAGLVTIHIRPDAVVRGEPPDGPQPGQRARVWCSGPIMMSLPPQRVADLVAFAPLSP